MIDLLGGLGQDGLQVLDLPLHHLNLKFKEQTKEYSTGVILKVIDLLGGLGQDGLQVLELPLHHFNLKFKKQTKRSMTCAL